MNLCKKGSGQRELTIFGTISSIADELIGIRTTEQRLCEEIESRGGQNNSYLLDRIEDLNSRVDKLDHTLDEYRRPRPARLATGIAADRLRALPKNDSLETMAGT